MGAEALGFSALAQINAMQAQMAQAQMQGPGLFNQYSGLSGGSMADALYGDKQIKPGKVFYADKYEPLPKQETTVANEKEILPDISITRVLKWGVVLLIAMFLGKRVWENFGGKITERIEHALKEVL